MLIITGIASDHKTEEITLPSYSVFDEDVYDAPIKTQVVLKILVSGDITKQSLKALLNTLYDDNKKRGGFTHHTNPTHVWIYAYTTEDRAEDGSGWIAMLQKTPDLDAPKIDINDRQMVLLGKEPEERFGLSEEKRKHIFKEIVQAEDRASKEAEEKYPFDPTQHLKIGDSFTLTRKTPLMPELEPRNSLESLAQVKYISQGTRIIVEEVAKKDNTPWYFVNARHSTLSSPMTGWINSQALIGQAKIDKDDQLAKQMDFQAELNKKYKTQVAQKYGLTLKQLGKISIEGSIKQWPLPKLKDN